MADAPFNHAAVVTDDLHSEKELSIQKTSVRRAHGMANYLRQQSPGQIWRNTFEIYGKGFHVIFLTYFLPVLPFMVWQLEMEAADNKELYWTAYFFGMIAGLFASGAITVAVSDICIGNKPSVVRSYRKIFGALAGKLLVTSLMQAIGWGMAFVPLIVLAMSLRGNNSWELPLCCIGFLAVPILLAIAISWLLFASSIVVLEGKWAFGALRRSREIGRGYNWRNLSVLFLLFSTLTVAWFILIAIFTLVFHFEPSSFAERLLIGILVTLSVPPFYIATVLLFYDLRVRKEDYDQAMLIEDLRR